MTWIQISFFHHGFLRRIIAQVLETFIILNEFFKHRPSLFDTFRKFFGQSGCPALALKISFFDFVSKEIDFMASWVAFYLFGYIILLFLELVKGKTNLFSTFKRITAAFNEFTYILKLKKKYLKLLK